MADRNPNRIGGVLQISIDGEYQDGKGEFTINDGSPVRTDEMGAAGEPLGYSEEGGFPTIEGVIQKNRNIDVSKLVRLDGVTVYVRLADGTSFMLSDAWFSGTGNLTTGKGEIAVKFTGKRGNYGK